MICPHCNNEFSPHHVMQRYCCALCRKRAGNRSVSLRTREIPVKRLCVRCGREFETSTPVRKFCSIGCREMNRQSIQKSSIAAYHASCPKTKPCVACDKPFQFKHRREVYCSNECRYKKKIEANRRYRRKPESLKIPKKCESCQHEFVPRTANHIYCSDCSWKRSMRFSVLQNRLARFDEHLLNGDDPFEDL